MSQRTNTVAVFAICQWISLRKFKWNWSK